MTKGNAYHVRIPADWLNDKAILELSLADRGLFIGMVTMSFNQGSKGKLTEPQIRNCAPPRLNLKQHLMTLRAVGLIERDPDRGDGWVIVHASEWGVGGGSTPGHSGGVSGVSQGVSQGGSQPSVTRSVGARSGGVSSSSQGGSQRPVRGDSDFKLAAQMLAGAKNAFHNDPDSLKEEKRKEESIRSPSGSDRMDSAQAAPRDAGGATQPAPAEEKKNLQPLGEFEDDSENDAVLFAGIEHLSGKDKAFAILAKHRKNNKHSTGRDVPLRRREWTPNRMIEPTDTAELFPGREWPEPSE